MDSFPFGIGHGHDGLQGVVDIVLRLVVLADLITLLASHADGKLHALKLRDVVELPRLGRLRGCVVRSDAAVHLHEGAELRHGDAHCLLLSGRDGAGDRKPVEDLLPLELSLNNFEFRVNLLDSRAGAGEGRVAAALRVLGIADMELHPDD